MKMKVAGLLGIGIAVTIVSGCHFNPGTYPVTEYDKTALYTDVQSKQKKESKAKIAVVVSAGEFKKDYKPVVDQLSSALNEKLSKFAFFEIVDRENLGIVFSENMLTSDDPTAVADLGAVKANFLLIAKINSLNADPNVGSVEGRFDFTWISPSSKKVLMKKSIRSNGGLFSMTTDPMGRLMNAASDAAGKFTMAVSAKYAPPARVLETRGDGEIARISMGSNYGLSKGMTVVFFKYVDNSAIVAGATHDESPIGNAEVKMADEKDAWVQMMKFPEVKACRGMFVKVPEQQESFVDGL